MKRDSRLSGVLHVLLHMAQNDRPVTSAVLAKAMDTNPVVLRRVMAGLREKGYVQSEKGHGGGWTLTRDLTKLTLRDVYAALGSPSLLAIGNRTEAPGCVVEEAVNAGLRKSFEDAESLLLTRLSEVTLAALSEDVRGRLATRKRARPSSRGRTGGKRGGVPHHEHEHDHGHPPHGAARAHHTFADASALSRVLEDPTRDAWQRPNDVLRALALKPTMTVADVGAGTGYFAVRLARALPQGKVIATDLEPGMVRFLRQRARRERLPNLHTLRATKTTSGLAAQSVDRILVVHVWHHLAEPGDYARGLAAALRPGGRLFVVDFRASGHRGPPASLRVKPDAVIAALVGAGLSAKASRIALPDQYIVEARRRP
ncbi:MAG: Rrf2 family transcriptional regulator [Myxococcales bacterium]|nr:Rrf2 family transcriptional regulator [Myxococcales bacterium]